MSNPRKLPIEPLQTVSENHGAFTHIARFTDSPSSFYLSFGAALLESLIRMKLCPRMSNPSWKKLSGTFTLAEQIATDHHVIEQFRSFQNLVKALEEAEITQARDWLNYFLDYNHQDAVVALDIGIRCVLASLKHNEPVYVDKIMNMAPFNYMEQKLVLTKIIQGLGVYTMIISKDRDIVVSDDGKHSHYLLVCIYKDDDHYYLAYDDALLYTWTNLTPPSEDMEVFPFTYIPPSRATEKPVPESLQNLINYLASKVINSKVPNDRLLQAINKAIDEFSILDKSYLKDLKNKISKP